MSATIQNLNRDRDGDDDEYNDDADEDVNHLVWGSHCP